MNTYRKLKFALIFSLFLPIQAQLAAGLIEVYHPKFTSKCANFVKKMEGFSGVPYLDTNRQWTLGYGKQGLKKKSITKREADIQLHRDLVQTHVLIRKNVVPRLSENQINALCSFAYNVGPTKFRKSSVLKEVNKGNFAEAAKWLRKWNKANGKVLNGLTRRRNVEALWIIS